MKANFEKDFCVTELALEEKLTTNGGMEGTQSIKSNFWSDVAFFLGATAKGCIVFATEGGKNTGICIK